MKTMFEVEISKEDRSWYRFVFKFETLDEAQQFVKGALTHFYKNEDDEDDEDMIIKLRYVQKFTTANDEKEEDDDEDHKEEN